MEENPDPTAAIDRLRRQRAHKRGLVTKLLKKINPWTPATLMT